MCSCSKKPVFSVIIPHKGEDHRIPKMKSQFEENLKYEHEIITIGEEVNNSAIARDLGAQQASGDILIFTDAHVCINDDINNLKETLDKYPNCFVTTIYTECNFDTDMSFTGPDFGGLYFDEKFDWNWRKPRNRSSIFIAPAGSACFFAVKRNVYNNVRFLHMSTKACAMDEEIFMRGWLLGYPHVVDPTVRIGHYFTGRDDPSEWLSRRPGDYVVYHHAITALVNFDGEVFNEINRACTEKWGDLWTEQLEKAREIWSEYTDEISQKGAGVWGNDVSNIQKWLITFDDKYAPCIDTDSSDVTERSGFTECLLPRIVNKKLFIRNDSIFPRVDCLHSLS